MPRAEAGADRFTRAQSLRWAIASLPLAPLALVAYLFFEWLFFITKPSPTAALPLGAQLLVLLKSPFPLLLPLLMAQLIASLASVVAHPYLRGVALLPAGAVCGLLLLMLIDNFTYTMFGFGIVRAGDVFRIGYILLFGLLTAVAVWNLRTWLGRWFLRPEAMISALAVTAVFLIPPLMLRAGPRLPRDPDANVLPMLQQASERSNRPNILFLGVDGVDASILSVYGYERATTPFLFSIREDTLLFENAFSNVARTHGALVTLLTGRLPFTTRVTFPPAVLQGEDRDRTLPSLLKGLGYTTLQLGMRHYADAEDTNVRGFDAANYRWQRLEEIDRAGVTDDTEQFLVAVAERIDERLGHLLGLAPAVDAFAHVEGRQIAPQWRDERRITTLVQYFERAPQPWFVHLHLLDTHCCQWVPDRMHFSGGASPMIDARDSQVRETDDNIRRLFAALEKTGRLEDTVVVLLSDHASEWKITERVPLMIRFPKRALTGRVTANVQLADIAPTMLSYLGSDAPHWMDGVSLLEPATLDAARRIFGVSDVKPFAGPSGFRTLLDSGPPNYGVASVMMVTGNQWFEISLISGELTVGRVRGHTNTNVQAMSEAEARRYLMEQIRIAGFKIEQAEVTTRPGVDTR